MSNEEVQKIAADLQYASTMCDHHYSLDRTAATILAAQSSRIARLEEALKLAREYVAAELKQRQDAYAGYPHKWSTEQEDLSTVDAALKGEA